MTAHLSVLKAALAVVLCGAAALPLPAQSAAPRVALVIGNAAYQKIEPLKNPRNDADDVCATLKRLAFRVHCHFDLASRGDLRQAVRAFASELGPDTVALFYFAGHAVQSRGDNYLLPVAIAPETALDIEDDGLSLSYLLRTLEEARSAPNIVIVDACRNEPFARSPSLKFARGLARVDPPVGTVLAYATAPGGLALDGVDRNGLFTKHLLMHLAAPGLRLADLFQLVARGVEDEARMRYRFEQVPYRSLSYAGSLCLAGCDDQRLADQMAELRARSEAAAQRIQALERENARLASGRSDPSSSGEVQARETELLQLRTQLQALRAQGLQLEEYQRRIKALERDNEEKSRRLGERDPPVSPPATRTIVVPSF